MKYVHQWIDGKLNIILKVKIELLEQQNCMSFIGLYRIMHLIAGYGNKRPNLVSFISLFELCSIIYNCT